MVVTATNTPPSLFSHLPTPPGVTYSAPGYSMAPHESIPEIEYEALPGGSLGANLAAGAFAGIMV